LNPTPNFLESMLAGRTEELATMTPEPTALEPTRRAAPAEAALRFLELSARLLLEYNTRSALIERRIHQIAKHFDVRVTAAVAYREVTLVAEDGRVFHAQAPELRINVAVSLGILRVIDDLCADRIELEEAMRRLAEVERTAPRYGRWLLAAIFALAASALARLLAADWAAMAVSGVSSGAGLIARQELGRRKVGLFSLPFAAGLIGACLGGTVIRLGWTGTPILCLVVPALMLVPGPHLINGVNDTLENHLRTAICRLGLSAGILIAAALGVVLGGWLTTGLTLTAAPPPDARPLTLPLDVALAGVAACGFGMFYNAPWRALWISIACGMVGHGIRFECLSAGVGVEIATLIACLAIGLIANLAAEWRHLPFSALAFAGAVPMMPGVFIYQGIGGALRMSAAGTQVDPALAATTLALLFKASFLVGAMAIGLLAGARIASLATAGRRRRRAST
jgi:uncharacterized membrane protein YjjP (DUF1212 family)